MQWLIDQPDKRDLVVAAYYDDPLESAAERYWRSEEWQAIEHLLPAMGYGREQMDELQAALNAMPADLVEAGCPDAQRFDGRPGFPEGRFGAFCSLNRNQFTATDPESRRLGALGSFGWRFDSGLEWFADVALQRNVSRADAALRKPISPQVRTLAHQVGLALILTLTALVFYNDIARLLSR